MVMWIGGAFFAQLGGLGGWMDECMYVCMHVCMILTCVDLSGCVEDIKELRTSVLIEFTRPGNVVKGTV